MSRRGGGTRVVVAGPAYCDLVFGGLEALPGLGEERYARHFLITAGGSAITAIALRRLGHEVALVADLGDDLLGAEVRRRLDAEGVDPRWLRVGATTPVTAALSTPGDRAFVTYLEAGDAPPDPVAALRGFAATHLHVAGFAVALALPDLVASSHAVGATVSFDPGWDATALADPRVRRVAAAADVLLPNRMEAERLAQHASGHAGDAAAGPNGDTASDAAPRALACLGRGRDHGVIVVKDGAAGAWGRDARGTVHVAAPTIDAVDPTGAGDVFDAGFLDAWWGGATLEACLRRGAWCGARATTAYGGATAAPTRAELEERR